MVGLNDITNILSTYYKEAITRQLTNVSVAQRHFAVAVLQRPLISKWHPIKRRKQLKAKAYARKILDDN